MSPSPTSLFSVVTRWLARAAGGPRLLARLGLIATLSVAETLLRLLRQGLVADIRRIKDTLVRRTEAETAIKEAEAQKRMAEAVDAANRANLAKRNDAIARAERDQARAAAAKTQAEADAIRMDAETRRLEAIIRAEAHLLEALSKLRQEGGDAMFSRENLKKLREYLLRATALPEPSEPPGPP